MNQAPGMRANGAGGGDARFTVNAYNPGPTAGLAASADALITMTGVRFDPSGMWRSDLPGRLTLPVSGMYFVWGSWYLSNCLSGGVVYMTMRVNGGNFLQITNDTARLTIDTTRQQVAGLYHFNAGDYVETHFFLTTPCSTPNNTLTNIEFGATLMARQ